MTDPQTRTLIKRLERSSRWWKRLALVAIVALVMVLLAGAATIISQRQQIQAEHQRTEQALGWATRQYARNGRRPRRECAESSAH
jgi:hypothetical protein